ncbi:MAG: hypothetical protein ACOYUB_02330 [Patescibacteria group bacterium]
MNKLFKTSVWSVLLILVAANIFLFVTSIGISDKINEFENKTNALHEENLSLEKKVSNLTSLDFARQKASELEFTKIAQPTYLERLGVAYKYSP